MAYIETYLNDIILVIRSMAYRILTLCLMAISIHNRDAFYIYSIVSKVVDSKFYLQYPINYIFYMLWAGGNSFGFTFITMIYVIVM